MSDIRIGQGYDAHRLVEGRKLILGGVDIPADKGLLGHSDADVLVHSIMDALLGALALGDIGKHFPDSSNEFLGISSISLLRSVSSLIENAGYKVVNVDSTVILQSPKISSYIEKMRENIADALSISPDCVSVKATTEEKMGFTGSNEGAKALAIALVSKK